MIVIAYVWVQGGEQWGPGQALGKQVTSVSGVEGEVARGQDAGMEAPEQWEQALGGLEEEREGY